MVNILIYAMDVIGETMAGPGIRMWEFAKALSFEHTVTLLTPLQTSLTHERFIIDHWIDRDTSKHHARADVILTQCVTWDIAWRATKYQNKIIIDLYCPSMLEYLELSKGKSERHRKNTLCQLIDSHKFYLKIADGILCASSRQRDLWLGYFLSLNVLKTTIYDQDPMLKNFMAVVPFGLSSAVLPQKSGPGPREIFNLKPTDKIILWGGSLSDWFDPCTLIKAMSQVKKNRADVKLVFIGIKHPNKDVPVMSITEQTLQLVAQLELTDTVFFNDQWFPYNERHNFLQESIIGISIHPEHLETNFSFRTRILDYIWAGLPIITTEGDVFAELVAKHHLGIVVPYGDSQAIAKAIIDIVENPSLIQVFKENLTQIQTFYQWETVVKPINQLINHFEKNKLRISKFKRYQILSIVFFKKIFQGIQNKGFTSFFLRILKKISRSKKVFPYKDAVL